MPDRTDRVVINTTIARDCREMLDQLSAEDMRTLGATLDKLIMDEYERRERPTALVDAAVTYKVETP